MSLTCGAGMAPPPPTTASTCGWTDRPRWGRSCPPHPLLPSRASPPIFPGPQFPKSNRSLVQHGMYACQTPHSRNPGLGLLGCHNSTPTCHGPQREGWARSGRNYTKSCSEFLNDSVIVASRLDQMKTRTLVQEQNFLSDYIRKGGNPLYTHTVAV